MRSSALGPMAFPILALVAAGCSAGRIESGVYYSSKGYQVSLPSPGWLVKRGGAADLELQRATPPGACSPTPPARAKRFGVRWMC